MINECFEVRIMKQSIPILHSTYTAETVSLVFYLLRLLNIALLIVSLAQVIGSCRRCATVFAEIRFGTDT